MGGILQKIWAVVKGSVLIFWFYGSAQIVYGSLVLSGYP
jgi:hypothetical protein